MKKLGAIVKNHYTKLLAIFAFLLIWQLVVMLFGIKEFILPSPIRTFSYLFIPELAAQYDWFTHIGTTLIEILIGFTVTSIDIELNTIKFDMSSFWTIGSSS